MTRYKNQMQISRIYISTDFASHMWLCSSNHAKCEPRLSFLVQVRGRPHWAQPLPWLDATNVRLWLVCGKTTKFFIITTVLYYKFNKKHGWVGSFCYYFLAFLQLGNKTKWFFCSHVCFTTLNATGVIWVTSTTVTLHLWNIILSNSLEFSENPKLFYVYVT